MTMQQRTMQFGWLAEQRMSWPELLEMVKRVEWLGYDSVWLSDHLADEDDCWLLDGWTALGAILGCVPRIEAGTLVASNSLRAPLLTAHMTRTLAQIAPGRIVLGLGAGGSRNEQKRVGIVCAALAQRVAALRGACEVIRHDTASQSPWHDPAAARGEVRPAVPLLIGGGSSGVLRVAGCYADRWAIWGSPAHLASRGEVLSQFVREAGRRREDVRRGAIVMVLPDHLPERPPTSPWPAELRGDKVGVTRQLEDYALAGVSDMILCDYGVSPGCRLAALEWFAPIMAGF